MEKLFPINRAVAVMQNKTTLFLSLVLNGAGYPFSVSVKRGKRKNILTFSNFKYKNLRNAGRPVIK